MSEMDAPAGFGKPHYREQGDLYAQIPEAVWCLPRKYLRAGLVVVRVLIDADRRGRLDDRLTTAELIALIERETGNKFGATFVKKGLYALHRVLKEMGVQVIDRARKGGRRIISFVRGLRESGKGKQRRQGSPILSPPLPPEDKGETRTTGSPSSSSSPDTPGKTDRADHAIVDALYRRARELVDDVSPGDVRAAVDAHSAEWVGRALGVMERRNRKPGNVRKPWGYVAGILRNRAEKGDWPDEPAPVSTAPVPPKPSGPDPSDAAEKAREKRLREAWGVLPETDRAAIRAAVRAEQPTLHRFPTIFDGACLHELGRRLDQVEPHARE